jgi:hypothetical protein
MSERYCEDCGDEMLPGTRRVRCKNCGELVCGWCHHHIHLLGQLIDQAAKVSAATPPEER